MTKTDAEHMLHRLFTALINPAVSLKDLKGFFTPDVARHLFLEYSPLVFGA